MQLNDMLIVQFSEGLEPVVVSASIEPATSDIVTLCDPSTTNVMDAMGRSGAWILKHSFAQFSPALDQKRKDIVFTRDMFLYCQCYFPTEEKIGPKD
jgi:hypothetical protein